MNQEILEYKDILMALPNPVFVTGSRGDIHFTNTATHTFLKDFGHQKIIGQYLDTVIKYPTLHHVYSDLLLKGKDCVSIDFSLFNSHISAKQYFEATISKLTLKRQVLMVVVLRDVTSLKHVEHMRRDFIANVSHELRTPLSTIIGFVETLQGQVPEGKSVQRKFLNIMAQESLRMKRVVDDLLSLSRIEQDEHIIPKGVVDVKKVIKFIAEGLLPVARSKNMRFVFDFSKNTTVNGDRDKLTQVFQNLMLNALKYGRKDGTVHVITKPCEMHGEDALSISVTDTGDGIDSVHINRLTERFYRVDKARSRQEGGTGLGLAIVKHIVQHHRGELKIESTVGKGSTFSVILAKQI